MEAWLAKLEEDDGEAAWDVFVDRYRHLIFATIRHYAEDYDDVMDIFAHVCESLRKDDLSRLKKFFNQEPHRARFSTWLVVVVRNLTIDWFRHRDGRERLSTSLQHLPPLHQQIYDYVVSKSYSHREAYETLRTRDEIDLTFGAFLRELDATFQALAADRRGSIMRDLIGVHRWAETATSTGDPAVAADQTGRLGEVLDTLASDERAAVLLFVVDEMPAAGVARIVGWPNAKAVYNRVYRALAAMRTALQRRGIEPGDL